LFLNVIPISNPHHYFIFLSYEKKNRIYTPSVKVERDPAVWTWQFFGHPDAFGADNNGLRRILTKVAVISLAQEVVFTEEQLVVI
jgi:hypothetical protein